MALTVSASSGGSEPFAPAMAESALSSCGIASFAMRASNGMTVEFYGTYREIDAPTRIVQTEIFAMFPDVVSVVTLTLTEKEGRTTLQSRSVYPYKDVRDQVIASGMEGGMRESYRQLTEVIGGLAQ